MIRRAAAPGRRSRLAHAIARTRASGDRGSTIPLILGFFLLAVVMTAGAIAAGQAFVQQRDLQELCDGASAAAAASAADLSRAGEAVGTNALRFARVQQAVDAFLAQNAADEAVDTDARLSDDDQIIQLRCVRVARIPFGALFGKPAGVRHVVTSSAREPVT